MQRCLGEEGRERAAGAFASSGLCSANCFLHVGFRSWWSCSQARFPPHALQPPPHSPSRNSSSPLCASTRCSPGRGLQAGPQQPRLHFFHIPVCWGVGIRRNIQDFQERGKTNALGRKKSVVLWKTLSWLHCLCRWISPDSTVF